MLNAGLWRTPPTSTSSETALTLLFRVVGHLPGADRRATSSDGLRAGVAQASREETAANATAGLQRADAMVIWPALYRWNRGWWRCRRAVER